MEDIYDKNIEISIKNTSPEMETVYLFVDTSVSGELKVKYIKSFEEAIDRGKVVCLNKGDTLTISYRSNPDEFHGEAKNDD